MWKIQITVVVNLAQTRFLLLFSFFSRKQTHFNLAIFVNLIEVYTNLFAVYFDIVKYFHVLQILKCRCTKFYFYLEIWNIKAPCLLFLNKYTWNQMCVVLGFFLRFQGWRVSWGAIYLQIIYFFSVKNIIYFMLN